MKRALLIVATAWLLLVAIAVCASAVAAYRISTRATFEDHWPAKSDQLRQGHTFKDRWPGVQDVQWDRYTWGRGFA